MKDFTRYALLNDLDEALVADCLPLSWGGVMTAKVAAAVAADVSAANAEAAGAQTAASAQTAMSAQAASAKAAAGFVIDEPVKVSGLARLGRFLTSGWGIGLAAGVVAVGVIAATVAGGWLRPQVPGGYESDTVAESSSDSEPTVTEPESTEEPGTVWEYETNEMGGIALPEGARVAVCNSREQMIVPDVYPLWTTVWMPGQNGAPGAMAFGDSFGMPPMEEMLDTLKGMTIRYDVGLTFVTAEGYRVSSMRLYDENGAFMYSVAEDELAVLDGRAGEGIYYVELGLLYTGRFIEEVSEHEESFFEVPFRLLIGDVERETLSSYPSETSPPFFEGERIP